MQPTNIRNLRANQALAILTTLDALGVDVMLEKRELGWHVEAPNGYEHDGVDLFDALGQLSTAMGLDRNLDFQNGDAEDWPWLGNPRCGECGGRETECEASVAGGHRGCCPDCTHRHEHRLVSTIELVPDAPVEFCKFFVHECTLGEGVGEAVGVHWEAGPVDVPRCISSAIVGAAE